MNKLPLNSTEAGLIYGVFPEAKFVFALRHPHDVILSCHMQVFVMTPARSNFLDLSDAADYYVKSMSLRNRFVKLLPLKVHYVRYESVAEDLEKEPESCLNSSSCRSMRRCPIFRFTPAPGAASAHPDINQVSQSAYTIAMQRWRKYGKYLAHVFDKLRPFTEQFGYAPGG